MTRKTTDTRKNRRPLVEPRNVVTIRPSASLKQAVELMRQRSVGCLVVVDEAGALKGILSERDVINRGMGNGGSLESITVGQAMTADVVCCEVGTSLDKIQRIMTTRRIRHLPLVRDGALVGTYGVGLDPRGITFDGSDIWVVNGGANSITKL